MNANIVVSLSYNWPALTSVMVIAMVAVKGCTRWWQSRQRG